MAQQQITYHLKLIYINSIAFSLANLTLNQTNNHNHKHQLHKLNNICFVQTLTKKQSKNLKFHSKLPPHLVQFTTMPQSQFNAYDHLHVSLNPDGTLTRHLQIPRIPVSNDDGDQLSAQAVVTKDVPLDPAKGTSVRIFRPTKFPSNDAIPAKLPILLYFHGGGWIDFHPASAMVHMNCVEMATELPAVLVSVDYRLAPENRLPAPYEDAVDALMWLKRQAADEAEEQGLREYCDFSRTYLYGTSNGGNIVYNAALRALDVDLGPVKIAGLIMTQPMFGGVKRTKQELKHATDQLLPLPAVDLYWELALPPGTDRDHRYSNPIADGPHKEKLARLGRCLVIGYNGDLMIDRQQAFVQMLILKGVPVEARFDDVGFHGIDMVDARRGAAIMNFMKEFM